VVRLSHSHKLHDTAATDNCNFLHRVLPQIIHVLRMLHYCVNQQVATYSDMFCCTESLCCTVPSIQGRPKLNTQAISIIENQAHYRNFYLHYTLLSQKQLVCAMIHHAYESGKKFTPSGPIQGGESRWLTMRNHHLTVLKLITMM